MAASSHIVVLTASRGEVGNGSHDRSPTLECPSSIIQNNPINETRLGPQKSTVMDGFNIPRSSICVGTKNSILSPTTSSNNRRRPRSESDGSKGDRRSIFGHYFEEKERTYSPKHKEAQ